ncbi:MAG TPA: hypothetical protein VN442_09165 [Bryobacteraceae bacterium]|nr:hypothetical protein [Bryobacteraceae bacterium]
MIGSNLVLLTLIDQYMRECLANCGQYVVAAVREEGAAWFIAQRSD